MGLSSAAALVLILSISTPLTSVCIYSSSHYSFPAIKSMCVEYVCSLRIWSLLSRALAHHYSADQPILITPRNIFLLVNLIILFLLISMHLQHHAPAAADKRSSKKKRQQYTENLKEAAAPLLPSEGSSHADDLTGSPAGAAIGSEALSCAAEMLPLLQSSMESSDSLQAPQQTHGSEESFNDQFSQSEGSAAASDEAFTAMESFIAEAAPMQEGLMKKLPAVSIKSLAVENNGALIISQDSPTVDSHRINGPDQVEQIVLEEDGRLRLIQAPRSPKGADAEKIEDGRLRLIEAINGSDEVVEEDGRLRYIDRPLPSNSSRPQKSLSDNYNHNGNYDSFCHNNFKYDMDSHNYKHNLNNEYINSHQDNLENYTLNHNHSNLNEVNDSTQLTLDYYSNPILSHNNINHDDAHHSTFTNRSSNVKRNISRPIRVKKSDSLDATWNEINQNKGSAINASSSSRDHKHLIRQSSRQGFKPSSSRQGGGTTRGLNGRVRREPSIGQEELNAKVESFIAKFNEQIRIERQQSILSFMQMVDRGA